MKRYIFWKLVNGKKINIREVFSSRTKEKIRADYQDTDFDGIDSVNIARKGAKK